MAWRKGLAVLLVSVTTACAGPSLRSASDFGQAPETAPVPPVAATGAPAGGQMAMAPGGPAVPAGFRAVALAAGISPPGPVTVDELGNVYVIDGGNRLVRLGLGGGRDLLAQGAAGVQWTGLTASGGVLFVTARGAPDGGQLLRIDGGGRVTVLVSGLPAGERGVESPRVGPDGLIYLGIGSLSPAGFVQSDAPWRRANPKAHDIPCQDVTLSGRNVGEGNVRTGAFVPYGTSTRAGQVIAGEVPCTGAVVRTSQDGGAIQLVAWGFDDPHSLAFTPEGRLYLLDGAGQPDGDRLFAVASGVWYGWPDRVQTGAPPVLAAEPNPPPPALARFPADTAATAFDVARAGLFGGSVEAYVGVAGADHTGRVLRINLHDGSVVDFAQFPTGSAAAALRFSADGESLYVIDQAGTLWRIGRDIPIG